MPRISIDVTADQHRQLKTLSSYSGLSMREFVLSRVFVEAAETVFSPKLQKSMKNSELQAAQNLMFKKAEILTIAPEKWERLKSWATRKGA